MMTTTATTMPMIAPAAEPDSWVNAPEIVTDVFVLSCAALLAGTLQVAAETPGLAV